MRKRACTDLCGGRSEMTVPTATTEIGMVANFRVARHPPRIRNQPVRFVSVIAACVRSELLRRETAQCWRHSRPKKC